MNTKNNECERMRAMLPSYAVGDGSSRDRHLVQDHIANCPACAKELRALERTGEMLSQAGLDPSPDLWEAIRPSLTPRKAKGRLGRLGWWLSAHRLQSAVAAGIAVIAITGWFAVAPHPQPNAEAREYLAGHVAMSWRDPFADKAQLGLVETIPVAITSEAAR
jgi:anti-sigma factor RsiW